MPTSKILKREELSKATLPALEASRDELKQKLLNEREQFDRLKKSVIEKLLEIFDKNKEKLTGPLAGSRRSFENTVSHAQDIYQLKEFIDKSIATISETEDVSVGYSKNSLGGLLTARFNALCTEGVLPREFDVHIRPKLPTEDDLVTLLGTASGGKNNQTHNEIIHRLAQNFQLAIDERNVRAAFDRAIEEAKTLQKGPRAWHFFSDVTDMLPGWLEELKKEYEKKGFLNAPAILGVTWQADSFLLSATETQIDLKKLSLGEQKEKLKKDNDEAFAYLGKRTYCAVVEDFIGEKRTKLNQLHDEIWQNDTLIDIEIIKEKYSDFWRNVIGDSNTSRKSCENADTQDFESLHVKIIKVRAHLERKGYLTTTFLDDKHYQICKKFELYERKTYKGIFKRRGEIRTQQINELREGLNETKTAEEAAVLIRDSLYEMERDHKSRSKGYNIKFLRFSSTAVKEGKKFKRKLEDEGLIPRIKEVKSIVLSDLRETIQAYYDRDIFKNNTSRVAVAERLFSDIRDIEIEEEKNDLHPSLAKQLKREAFDRAIQDAELDHQQGSIASKLLRYLYKPGKSRLADSLTLLRDRLSTGVNPQLSISYSEKIWPVIEKCLTEVIERFAADTSLTMPPSPPSMGFFGRSSPPPKPIISEADKQEALGEARSLRNSLQIAGDKEVANAVLAENIQRMRSPGFVLPSLGDALFSAHQELQRTGTLDIISQSDFSRQIQIDIQKFKNHIIIRKRIQERSDALKGLKHKSERQVAEMSSARAAPS